MNARTAIPSGAGARKGIMLFLAVAAVFAAARLFFLTGPIDEPAWRQAENAYVARRMMAEHPPDLLHPKCPNRGLNDVRLNELPVHAAGCALAYQVLGRESLPVARFLTWLSFVAAALYFRALVARLYGPPVAAAALAVYTLLPLGFFYSRAMHYDFMILWFAHGFTYHLLCVTRRAGVGHFAAAAAYGALVGVMKLPYLATCLPLLAWPLLELLLQRRWGSLACAGFLLLLTLSASFALDHLRYALDAPFTESVLYPQKITPAFMRSFFLGSLAERADPARWHLLLSRLKWVVLTPAGALLVGVGALFPGLWNERARRWGTGMLVLGSLVYLLVLFRMVASPHDYYSLPFLAPAALFAGAALAWVWGGDGQGRAAALRRAACLVLLAATAWGSCQGLRAYGYFRHDLTFLSAGAALARETQPDDLVAVTTRGRSSGWTDPRLHYYADRRGWVLGFNQLAPEVIQLYRHAGARWFAVVCAEAFPPETLRIAGLEQAPDRLVRLQEEGGAALGWLVLYDLQPRSPHVRSLSE